MAGLSGATSVELYCLPPVLGALWHPAFNTKTVADSDAVEKKLLFTPGRLTDGIELSDDPLLTAGDGAYAESYKQRSAQESASMHRGRVIVADQGGKVFMLKTN